LLGMDNPELDATFKQAVDRKLYDEVNDRAGRRIKAYARTNAAEYFAEISCAYLDSCNYFPFNHSQLQGHDPAGYKFLERVWKHPERFTAIAKKPAAGSDRTSIVAVRSDVYAERDAQLRLDRLRAQANGGPTEQVKKGLLDLVRTFPGTTAADDARQMLGAMK